MPRRGARRKKTRTHDLKAEIEQEAPSGPCSFIVKKGRVGKVLSELVGDLRQLMSPNTFSNLKESKRNSALDYIQVAGSLGATHLIRVSSKDKNIPHIHLSRAPAGPCFDFRVEKFSLISDIRREVQSGAVGLSRDDERYPPVAILTGFKNANDEFSSLLSEALKGLVPVIEIDKINAKTCRRVILFSYSEELLSIRHYRVTLSRKALASLPSDEKAPAAPGISKILLGARKSSKIPSLGNLVSISDLIASSERKQEPAENQVELVSGNAKRRILSSLVLTEVGPRIDASLARVLSGVEEGTVLFAKHAPETVGTTVVKKKPKRVYSDAKRASKPRKQSHEIDADAEMSE